MCVCDVITDCKRHKTSRLPDLMTGVAIYFQNVTPPSLVSKLARRVIAYPSVILYQFAYDNNCPKKFGNRPHRRLVTPHGCEWIRSSLTAM